VKTKLICELELEPEVVLLELSLLEPAGRSSDQGTATVLPLPLEPSEDDERVLLLVPELVSLDNEPEDEPLAPDDSTEIIAKSTLPELGLMITSLMLPRLDSPDDALTGALINLLAWISWCCPPRPVALNEPELVLPDECCL